MTAGEQIVAWVPFRMKDETLGAMRLSDALEDRRFAEGELSFARALGEHAAIALNNARLYAQIEDLAMKDGLTGLANHRRFYDRLAEEIERGRRYGTPVALLMLDIDDFKRLNDTYGHPAGDEVLRLHRRDDDGGAAARAAIWRRATAARSSASSSPTPATGRCRVAGLTMHVLRQAPAWTWLRTSAGGRRPPRGSGGAGGAATPAHRRDCDFPVGPDHAAVDGDGEHRRRVVPGDGGRHGRAGRVCGRRALRGQAGRQGQGQGALKSSFITRTAAERRTSSPGKAVATTPTRRQLRHYAGRSRNADQVSSMPTSPRGRRSSRSAIAQMLSRFMSSPAACEPLR